MLKEVNKNGLKWAMSFESFDSLLYLWAEQQFNHGRELVSSKEIASHCCA